MGGKPKADNSAVVQQQQQEAAQAAQKEADRQARLQQGLASIKSAFEGGAITKPTTANFDWSSFNGQNAPSGYTAVRLPSAAAGTGNSGRYETIQSGRGTPVQTWVPDPVMAAPAAAASWGLQDASGKIYRPGDAISITTAVPTGETSSGFDDAFYNKYKQAVLDYYMPQVDKQYKDAKDELTYRLARSGNLRSSAANTDVADLQQQNDLNQAGVRNQADSAAGDLRSQVASERAKATSQLYATEDPEVAANQALSSVRDISLQQPDLSPLSALFDVATVGGANVLKGYQTQQTANAFNTALPKTGAQRVVS